MKRIKITPDFCWGFLPSTVLTSLTLSIHWLLYLDPENEVRINFEAFFGCKIIRFNPFIYLIVWVVLTIIFGLIFSSDKKGKNK